MYAIGAVLDKEPAVIAGALRSILYVLVLVGAFVITVEQLAAIALAAEVLLGLFVRAKSTSTASPTLAAGTEVTVVTPAGEENRTVTV